MRDQQPQIGPIRCARRAAGRRPGDSRQLRGGRHLRAGWIGLAAGLLLACLAASGATAGADSREQMQSLDGQVQEIKSDVLGIAAELSRLEEKLLYPSNTQVAVFIAFPGSESFRLDAVRIQIDGEPVAHHVYSFKELEALEGGGVQRIYTGNVPTGEHQLEVSVSGQVSGGKEVSSSQSFAFRKEAEPKLLGVNLAPEAAAAPRIELGGW